MRKSGLVAVTFAISVLLLLAVSATAQETARAEARGKAKSRAAKAKAAVVAIRKGEELSFAADKARLMGYVQRVFEKTKERGGVTDISLRSFEKEHYMAVQLERQGTLFLHLVPSGGGIQGIFFVGDDQYLYCASEGCTSCFLDRSNGPVVCSCDATINQGPSSGCKLKPRLYVHLAVAELNEVLLAEGFELADTSTATEGHPKVRKASRSRRRN